jgi:hypothetical protein
MADDAPVRCDNALASLREILKDWKSTTPVKRIERSAPKETNGAHENILTPDKANAVFTGLAFPLKETDADCDALWLGNFIFGGGALTFPVTTPEIARGAESAAGFN